MCNNCIYCINIQIAKLYQTVFQTAMELVWNLAIFEISGAECSSRKNTFSPFNPLGGLDSKGIMPSMCPLSCIIDNWVKCI